MNIEKKTFLIGFVFSFLLVCSSCNVIQTVPQTVAKEDDRLIQFDDVSPIAAPNDGVPIWNGTWGGNNYDDGRGIWTDGSIVYTIGYTQSFGQGLYDQCLVKWTTSGVKVWNFTYGPVGSTDEYGQAIWANGSAIYTVGSTGLASNCDLLLVRWNTAGGTTWTQTWDAFGSEDRGYSIWSNGTVIYICGKSYSVAEGSYNATLTKWNMDGGLLWARNWGGIYSDCGNAVWANDSGVYVCGETQSYGAGSSDLFLLKYDHNGNKLWNYTWGGANWDYGYGIWGDNNGIYTSGSTQSYGVGGSDMCLIKWDSVGNPIWYRVWGGSSNEIGHSLWGNSSAIYTCGQTESFGAGGVDTYVVKWSINGNQLWNQTYGGPSDDYAYSIYGDNMSLYTVGRTNSFGYGSSDYYFIKWVEKEIPSSPTLQAITPNPNMDGNITLNWNIVGGASSYKVYRSTLSITSLIGLTAIATPTSNSYLDKITSNGTYYYVVTAVNASGESDISNCESIVVAITLNSTTNNTNPETTAKKPFTIAAYPFVVFYTITISAILIIIVRLRAKRWNQIKN